MPKFQDLVTWQQAEQLMQPAFIRLVDHLRKQLEQSTWEGTYEDVPVWAEAVSDDVKFKVMQLQKELQVASATDAIAIESALAQLPSPYPGYHLHLQQQEQQVTVDLWELCYQVCFQDYDAASERANFPQQHGSRQGVIIDQELFDETGAVDWNRLDGKARRLVEQLFSNLPVALSRE